MIDRSTLARSQARRTFCLGDSGTGAILSSAFSVVLLVARRLGEDAAIKDHFYVHMFLGYFLNPPTLFIRFYPFRIKELK
jgi:hypothetical protein